MDGDGLEKTRVCAIEAQWSGILTTLAVCAFFAVSASPDWQTRLWGLSLLPAPILIAVTCSAAAACSTARGGSGSYGKSRSVRAVGGGGGGPRVPARVVSWGAAQARFLAAVLMGVVLIVTQALGVAYLIVRRVRDNGTLPTDLGLFIGALSISAVLMAAGALACAAGVRGARAAGRAADAVAQRRV